MSEMCCEVKEPSIKDLMINQREMMLSLNSRLDRICKELGCYEETPSVADCGINNMFQALSEINDYLKYAHDDICRINRILGIE